MSEYVVVRREDLRKILDNLIHRSFGGYGHASYVVIRSLEKKAKVKT